MLFPKKQPYFRGRLLMMLLAPFAIFIQTSLHMLYGNAHLPRMSGVKSIRKFQKSSLQLQPFKNLVESFLESLEDEEMIEFAITAWKIWKRRNELVFNKIFMHPNSLIQQVKVFIKELNQVQHVTKTSTTDLGVFSQWEAPPHGNLKLNWDATLDKTNCKVGVGAVIRDWEGKVKATMRMNHDLYPIPCW